MHPWSTSRFTLSPGQTTADWRRIALLPLGAVMAILLSAPAAAGAPSARLVRCGEHNCLQISGERQESSHIVSVNRRAVAAEGGRHWRVSLPVDTVREWSDPYAREIEISLADPRTRRELATMVRLPIGLLGGVEMSALVVTVN